MKDGRRVVLLTGANGFVGRNIAPALSASGMIVRKAMRKPSSEPNTVVIDTIGPDTNWDEALRGVDALVHLAARVHHPREEHASESIAASIPMEHCSLPDAPPRQACVSSSI